LFILYILNYYINFVEPEGLISHYYFVEPVARVPIYHTNFKYCCELLLYYIALYYWDYLIIQKLNYQSFVNFLSISLSTHTHMHNLHTHLTLAFIVFARRTCPLESLKIYSHYIHWSVGVWVLALCKEFRLPGAQTTNVRSCPKTG